jgi:hypothetical protein
MEKNRDMWVQDKALDMLLRNGKIQKSFVGYEMK